MRSTLSIVLCVLIIIGACHKAGSKQCPSDDYAYTFVNNARIDTVSRPIRDPRYNMLIATVVPGARRVFTYQHIHSECPDVQDGGSTGTLVFEADPNVSHFKYYADSVAAANCYWRTSCYGCNAGAVVPIGGTIEGTRVNDNKWKIDIDVKTNSSSVSVLKVSADFIPGQ